MMFRQVRDEVLKQTNNLQEPWTTGSLSGTPFYLAGASEGATDVAQVADTKVAWSEAYSKPDQEQQLRALADGGDTRSMMGLAFIRQNPQDKRFSPAEAAKYFQRAADAGAADAEYELAKVYEQGLGVDPDPDKALKLYQASAAQGYPDAINDLGFLYFQGGLGLTTDKAKGVDLFRQAADLRHPEAMFNYAGMIDEGLVSSKGPADAAGYLYQALRSGSDQVLNQLTTNSGSFKVKTLGELQKLLKQHQFFAGKTDGKFGASSIAAIKIAYGLKG